VNYFSETMKCLMKKAKNYSVIATFSGKDERNILSRKKYPKKYPKPNKNRDHIWGYSKFQLFPSNAIINTLDETVIV